MAPKNALIYIDQLADDRLFARSVDAEKGFRGDGKCQVNQIFIDQMHLAGFPSSDKIFGGFNDDFRVIIDKVVVKGWLNGAALLEPDVALTDQ